MIPVELISMGVGAISGFAMKVYSLKMQDEQNRFNRMMEAIKASDNSANQASQRVPNDKNGNWIRRIIVLAILFGVILAPFILSFTDNPTIVEIQQPQKSFLGLFKYGGKTVFYELKGYLLIPELRQSLVALISFYFGQSAAKR